MENGNAPEHKDDEEGKVIHFPALEARAKRDQAKIKAENDKSKADKERAAQEKIWREQYRAEQAKKMAQMARGGKGGGKVPMVNWDKIPYFSRVIVGISFLVQAILMFGVGEAQRLELYYTLGFVPAAFTGGVPFSLPALLSPVTCLFLHSGWMHFAMNMFMLVVMSVFFERNFGARRCAIFFFASGLMGCFVYLIMSPFTPVPVVGASGAISGLFAVNMLVMSERGAMAGLGQARDGFKFLLFWMVVIIVTGIAFQSIAWQAHLGGFLGGAGLYMLWKRGKIKL